MNEARRQEILTIRYQRLEDLIALKAKLEAQVREIDQDISEAHALLKEVEK